MVGHTMDVLSPFISVLCHFNWLFHGSPAHVLMLFIQAVHGLPRLHAPGIVPCIISFSRQLSCFLVVWPQYASFLAFASTVSNSSLFTPALLRTHLFVFLAVHKTRRIFLSPFISKASRPVSSFRRSRNKLNRFNLFRLYRKYEIYFEIFAKTGNDVEATFDFVKRIVRFVAFDNVASTLLLVWTGLYSTV